MDQKAWKWRKKSSEKTKVDASVTQNADETVATEKETVTDLNEKLVAAVLDCRVKDELLMEHIEMSREAIAAKEKAETDAERLKQELHISNEIITQSHTQLEACKQELVSLRQKIRENETKAIETSKTVENLSVENARLTEAEAEAKFTTLIMRSDSTAKENAFLKCELEIRREEIEFYKRSTDASHKQNYDNVKKITKLEAECQSLRSPARKRLPVPSAMPKPKGEAQELRDTLKERLHAMHERRKNAPELNAIADSDMSLMDDFVEMEKLATMSASAPFESDKDLFPVIVNHSDTTLSSSIRKIMNLIENFHPKIFKQLLLMTTVQSCEDQLNEKVGIGELIEQLSLALEWIFNSYNDAQKGAFNVRKKIKKCSVSSELQIENEAAFVSEDNEDDDNEAQLTAAKAKLNEAFKKVSSLEVELEEKRNCCEELESTCLELQLQLESVVKKETCQCGVSEEEKGDHKDGWEIKAASVKLAECQETILHLGKQLKALSSPRHSSVYDRLSSTNNKNITKRSSLLDQMLAEDTYKSPHNPYLLHIVPIKKQGGFFRRLLLTRKKKKKLIAHK